MTRREPPVHHDGRSTAPTESYENSDPAHNSLQIRRLQALVDELVRRLNEFQRSGVELATKDDIWALEQRIIELERVSWWRTIREGIMMGIVFFVVLWGGIVTGIAAVFASQVAGG